MLHLHANEAMGYYKEYWRLFDFSGPDPIQLGSISNVGVDSISTIGISNW
jgi:hypothetical protein